MREKEVLVLLLPSRMPSPDGHGEVAGSLPLPLAQALSAPRITQYLVSSNLCLCLRLETLALAKVWFCLLNLLSLRLFPFLRTDGSLPVPPPGWQSGVPSVLSVCWESVTLDMSHYVLCFPLVSGVILFSGSA